MGETIDLSAYLVAPLINQRSGVALAIALLHQKPKDASEGVQVAARGLRSAAEAVQAVWQREKPEKAPSLRPFDTRSDVSWGALTQRLRAWAMLDAERYPEAAEAARLLELLELNSLEWLKQRYKEQWADAKRRVDYADTHDLVGAIDRLAGPAFLAEVRDAQASYGVALGITARQEVTDEAAAMAEPLAALSAAIVEYALQVCAMRSHKDPAVRSQLKAALRPIDEHRASLRAARTADVDAAVGPDTPLPEA